MSGGSLFTIVFDSRQKKIFGITGHLGEVIVNGRTLPHGEIVALEFSGFKELFVSPKKERDLNLNLIGEKAEEGVQEAVTIPPDLSILTPESVPTVEIKSDLAVDKVEGLPELQETPVESPLEIKVRAPLENAWIEGFDFEQIQYRVLTRLQSGLERALKIARNPQGIPEKIWKPLEGDAAYKSEGDFLFAKESLENENRFIYHRVAQLKKSILDLIQSHSDPSASLIPMIPRADLIASKKAANAFNSARYKEAQSLYQGLYSKDKGSLYLLSNLGSVEYLCGNTQASIDYLEKAILMAPYDGFSYGTLAIVKSQNGRSEEAIDEAIASVALTPEIAESYLGLGIILYDRGWHEKSKESLQEGLTKNPNSGDIHRALAKTLRALGEGESEKCKFHYKRSVELGVKKDLTFN
jgi:tetratricopeptide (TPR) repeat protein